MGFYDPRSSTLTNYNIIHTNGGGDIMANFNENEKSERNYDIANYDFNKTRIRNTVMRPGKPTVTLGS